MCKYLKGKTPFNIAFTNFIQYLKKKCFFHFQCCRNDKIARSWNQLCEKFFPTDSLVKNRISHTRWRHLRYLIHSNKRKHIITLYLSNKYILLLSFYCCCVTFICFLSCFPLKYVHKYFVKNNIVCYRNCYCIMGNHLIYIKVMSRSYISY